MRRRMYSLEKKRQSLLTEISFCLSALIPLGAGPLSTVNFFLSVGSKLCFFCYLRRWFKKPLYILLYFCRFCFSQSSSSVLRENFFSIEYYYVFTFFEKRISYFFHCHHQCFHVFLESRLNTLTLLVVFFGCPSYFEYLKPGLSIVEEHLDFQLNLRHLRLP